MTIEDSDKIINKDEFIDSLKLIGNFKLENPDAYQIILNQISNGLLVNNSLEDISINQFPYGNSPSKKDIPNLPVINSLDIHLSQSIDRSRLTDQIPRSANGEYFSPFDGVDSASLDIHMPFQGTLNSVVGLIRSEESTAASLIMNTARLIRGAIEYKIENPGELSHQVVLQTIETAMNLYRNPSERSQILDLHLDAITKMGVNLDQFLQRPIFQKYDVVTGKVSNSENITEAADRMNKFQGERVLFIPLANGAVPAGIDVFIQSLNKGNIDPASVIHPLRCSTHKEQDRSPRISSEEDEMIKRYIAEGYHIVLFEEDICSGHTIQTARRHFETTYGVEPTINYCENFQSQIMTIIGSNTITGISSKFMPN